MRCFEFQYTCQYEFETFCHEDEVIYDVEVFFVGDGGSGVSADEYDGGVLDYHSYEEEEAEGGGVCVGGDGDHFVNVSVAISSVFGLEYGLTQ